MRQLSLSLPTALERCPELAPLDILESALSVSESALMAACPEIQNGRPEAAPRGSIVLRANAIVLQARRLATAITAYRDALFRDARREERAHRHNSF
jgi:hypothetical protein